MRQKEPLHGRSLGSRQRFLGAQVPPRLAVVLATIEGRLADEEVAVSGELGKALARATVP